jgi:hypothetical protein
VVRYILLLLFICSLFISYSTLAYKKAFKTVNTYSGDTFQLPSSLGHFPENHVLFDAETKLIAIAGQDNGTFNEKIYLWQYIEETQEAKYVSSADFNIPKESAQFSSIKLVGFQEKSLFAVRYIKNSDYDQAESSLLRFEIDRGTLTLVQENILSLNGNHSWIMQTLFLDKKTIVAFHDAPAGIFYSVCSLNDLQQIDICSEHELLPQHHSESRMSMYKVHSLDAIKKYLLAPITSTGRSEAPISRSLLLEFNQKTNLFSPIQSLPTPIDSRVTYTQVHEGVDSAFVTDDAKSLHIGYGKSRSGYSQYYYTNDETGLWVNSEITSRNFPSGFNNSDNSFFIYKGVGHVFLLDDRDNIFYRTTIRNNHQGSDVFFTAENKGFSVSDSASLTTFDFDNKPTLYKGGITTENIEFLQDEVISLNYGQYFINAQSIKVTGLPDNLTWDGENITGVFTNTDIFTTNDPNNPEKFDFFSLNFHVPEALSYGQTSVASHTLSVVNLNDAPILIKELTTEQLIKDELYTGDLRDFVKDPDREKVIFTFENIPDGLSTNSTGVITGAISTPGLYNINVEAKDEYGGSTLFVLKLDVNGFEVNEKATSSNGGSFGFIIFLLLLLKTRINFRKK